MEKQHPLTDLMGTAMEKIRTMVDANTIIGTPIQTGDVTLIPVSRLSFGIASGGSDFTTKNQKPEADNSFGGGRASSCCRWRLLRQPRWTGSSRRSPRWWTR